MHVDFDKMTKDFMLNERKEPTLMEYLNVVSEMIEYFKPSKVSESSRLAVMKENLRKARKHARLMEERLKLLEEQVNIIEETKEKSSKHKDEDLTPEEKKLLGKANVYAMDWEMDGGTLPEWVDKMMHASYKPSNHEKRKLIQWFRENARGDY